MKKNSWKAKVIDDCTSMDIVDSEDQLLKFRVGQVFFKKGSPKLGLWVWYQEKNMASKQKGPFLMDKDSWDELKKYVDKKFRSFNKPVPKWLAKKIERV